MPNHYHLLVRQNSDTPINKLILKVFTSYSIYFNKKYQRVGHLFQDNFKAKLVEDDVYLKLLTAYIHNNPNNKETYKYSSYQDYISFNDSSLVEVEPILKLFPDPKTYLEFVHSFKITDHPDTDIEDLIN